MSAGVEIKRIDTGGKQKQGVKLRKFMLAGKSLLTLANNIKVLACNRSGEPKAYIKRMKENFGSL